MLEKGETDFDGRRMKYNNIIRVARASNSQEQSHISHGNFPRVFFYYIYIITINVDLIVTSIIFICLLKSR